MVNTKPIVAKNFLIELEEVFESESQENNK
jgi:hypothetical protein